MKKLIPLVILFTVFLSCQKEPVSEVVETLNLQTPVTNAEYEIYIEGTPISRPSLNSILGAQTRCYAGFYIWENIGGVMFPTWIPGNCQPGEDPNHNGEDEDDMPLVGTGWIVEIIKYK